MKEGGHCPPLFHINRWSIICGCVLLGMFQKGAWGFLPLWMSWWCLWPSFLPLGMLCVHPPLLLGCLSMLGLHLAGVTSSFYGSTSSWGREPQDTFLSANVYYNFSNEKVLLALTYKQEMYLSGFGGNVAEARLSFFFFCSCSELISPSFSHPTVQNFNEADYLLKAWVSEPCSHASQFSFTLLRTLMSSNRVIHNAPCPQPPHDWCMRTGLRCFILNPDVCSQLWER